MPDQSTISEYNLQSIHNNKGIALRGNQVDQIGRLLNNISAQNGLRAVVGTGGIKLYGTQSGSNLFHRFKIVKSSEEDSSDSDGNPQIIVYEGSWIRGDSRINLECEEVDSAGRKYHIISNAELVNNKTNYIYIELDKSYEPVTLQAKATDTLSDIEPSTHESDGNIYVIIGYVKYTDGELETPVQYVMQDIIKDNPDIIEETSGVYTDGGASGVTFEILTAFQYDTSAYKLQKKIREVTIKNGYLIFGVESDWIDVADTEPCP